MRMRRRGLGLVAVFVLAAACAGASGLKASAPPAPRFASVEYRAPNPLGRSRFVTLHSDGRVGVTDIMRSGTGVREQRWISRADPSEVAAVARLLTPLEALPERPARTGIPGETIVELRVTPVHGPVQRRSKWLGDPVAGFDGAEAHLSALARRAQASPPDYDGPSTQPP
jgi:hypothetical protein